MKKLILAKPKIVFNVKKGKRFDAVAVPVEQIDCGLDGAQILNVNPYFCIGKKIIQLLSKTNELYIVGQREESDQFHSDNVLRPRSQMEDDNWHTLLAIQKNFNDLRCFDVGEITNEVDTHFNVHCKDCGIIKGMSKCKDCDNIYPEKNKECGNCGSKDCKPAHVKRGEPGFSEKHITPTVLASGKTKCPLCKSINLTKPKKIPCYRLIIKRQKRFELDEDA